MTQIVERHIYDAPVSARDNSIVRIKNKEDLVAGVTVFIPIQGDPEGRYYMMEVKEEGGVLYAEEECQTPRTRSSVRATLEWNPDGWMCSSVVITCDSKPINAIEIKEPLKSLGVPISASITRKSDLVVGMTVHVPSHIPGHFNYTMVVQEVGRGAYAQDEFTRAFLEWQYETQEWVVTGLMSIAAITKKDDDVFRALVEKNKEEVSTWPQWKQDLYPRIS